jgi:hypothetical protein
MFIKKLIYDYNANALLLATSKLAFALDAWLALIFIMELTIVLFLATKENVTKEISTHCFGFT